MRSSGSVQKFKGGAYGLEILKDLPPNLKKKAIDSFEQGIDDVGKFRFDIKFKDGINSIFVETKNYAKGTVFSDSFYKQFKNYIANPNVKSIDQIKYFFRNNADITKAERVGMFKKMINSGDRKSDLFNSMSPNLKNDLNIETISDLNDDMLGYIFNAITEVY